MVREKKQVDYGEVKEVEGADGVAFSYPNTIEIIHHERRSRGAWASLILGIIGSLGWIVPVIGFPVTVVGIVLGALGMGKHKANRGVAIAGFVVNIVFVCAAIAKGIVDIVRYFKKR